jgi:MOSC domain-containing protein YiiM
VNARVVQVSVSPGGVPKRGVEAARVGTLGLEGDGHRDTRYHGGPERAVCLYPLEAIDALAAEGHPVTPGSLGENLTVHGLDWDGVVPGIRLRVGDAVLLEVTRYTSPCSKIAGAFADGDHSRVSQKLWPGWSRVYARVLVEGSVRRGDPVRLVGSTHGADTVGASPVG